MRRIAKPVEAMSCGPRLTRGLGEAAARPGFHSQAGADPGGGAVGAGEKLAFLIVQLITNAFFDVGRQVQEQFAVFGVDAKAIRRGADVVRLGDGVSVRIVQVELDEKAAFRVGGDLQDHLSRRSIEERDRGARATMS